jgi:hypothetical protein
MHGLSHRLPEVIHQLSSRGGGNHVQLLIGKWTCRVCSLFVRQDADKARTRFGNETSPRVVASAAAA